MIFGSFVAETTPNFYKRKSDFDMQFIETDVVVQAIIYATGK